MSATAIQILCGSLTVAALFLIGRKGIRPQLWGWGLMFAGQPFWLAATWMAEQWGMFAVSIAYTWVAFDSFKALRRRRRVQLELYAVLRLRTQLDRAGVLARRGLP